MTCWIEQKRFPYFGILPGIVSALVLIFAGSTIAFAQEEDGDAPEAVVEPITAESYVVSVFQDENEPDQSVSGVIVGHDNSILTTSAIADDQSSLFVLFEGVDDVFKAVIDEVDFDRGVALIRVASGPESEPVIFAKEAPETGEAVTSVYYQSDQNEVARISGAIGNQLIVPKGNQNISFWEHNASIPRAGFGGALMNICGEKIALNVVDPIYSRRKARRLQEPETGNYAFKYDELLRLLVEWGVSPEVSESACGRVADVVDESQRTIEAAEKELEETKARAAKAREDAENAERIARKQKEEAESIKKDAEATEDEKREAEEAAERAEDTARKAATALADFDRKVLGLESEVAALVQSLKAAEQQRLYFAIAGVVGVLVVGGLGGFFVWRRSGQLEKANKQRSSVEAELARTFPDIECRGKDANNDPHAFKITGSALIRAKEGLVVGRQPQAANIVLNHPEVSRSHLRVKLKDEKLYVEDLDSLNGSMVNGRRLVSGESSVLENGDELSLGDLLFKVSFIDV